MSCYALTWALLRHKSRYHRRYAVHYQTLIGV
jgi:hypothetical protein